MDSTRRLRLKGVATEEQIEELLSTDVVITTGLDASASAPMQNRPMVKQTIAVQCKNRPHAQKRGERTITTNFDTLVQTAADEVWTRVASDLEVTEQRVAAPLRSVDPDELNYVPPGIDATDATRIIRAMRAWANIYRLRNKEEPPTPRQIRMQREQYLIDWGIRAAYRSANSENLAALSEDALYFRIINTISFDTLTLSENSLLRAHLRQWGQREHELRGGAWPNGTEVYAEAERWVADPISVSIIESQLGPDLNNVLWLSQDCNQLQKLAVDIDGPITVELPNGVCCSHTFRSAECGYSGRLRTCPKTLTGCRARDNIENFGGVPEHVD
jgi:hypothetical protein